MASKTIFTSVALLVLGTLCNGAEHKKLNHMDQKKPMNASTSTANENEILKIATNAIKNTPRVIQWSKEGYHYLGTVKKVASTAIDLPNDKESLIWEVSFTINGPIMDQGITVYISPRAKTVLLIHEDGA